MAAPAKHSRYSLPWTKGISSPPPFLTFNVGYSFLLFSGTLHSDAYIFPFLLCFLPLFFSQLFVRPPQTAILLFCISFQAGIKIAGRNINNLRYADDSTLMAESEEELKNFLMKVKEESGKKKKKLA